MLDSLRHLSELILHNGHRIDRLVSGDRAARSYAVVTRRHARDGFDLCAKPHCQVWRAGNRSPESDRAVDETSSQVVTFKGRIVAPHFFGHCDGRTRDPKEVWPGTIRAEFTT